MLHCILVDDEPRALETLAWELEQFKEEISVVQTFTQPEEAIVYLKKNPIDCVFLDIEMPSMDGFQLLEQVGRIDFAIVFTTAYNEYAIQALKKQAIDYLLKPIDSDDLRQAIQKIKKHKSNTEDNKKFEHLLLHFNERFQHKKIAINTDGKLVFLDPDEICYAASDGNYTTLYLEAAKKIVVTKKLKEINALLPEHQFFRVHHSYIINMHKIKEFLKTDGYIILEDGSKIPVSRQEKSQFLNNF